ncbi:MAG: DUF6531 domain-containing protein, partial [Acidimicrobiales bacterium]
MNLGLVGVVASQATALPESTTFEYTGASQAWVVPGALRWLSVDVQAASGRNGGGGGRVEAVLAVTPGETLLVNVGSGFGSFNGGASDIRRGGAGAEHRIVVAGAGGNGGGGGSFGGPGYRGGLGGGRVGGSGEGPGGTGGTHDAGGSGGSPGSLPIDGLPTPGQAGSSGSGGAGGLGNGGSGGGGYFGGGGGGGGRAFYYEQDGDQLVAFEPGAGGGGGSSYTHPSATGVAHTQGFRAGNGVVVLGASAGPVIEPTERLGGNPHLNMTCPGGADPDPVQVATGNFWQTFTDFAIPGRGPDLALRRTYNSLAAGRPGPFGPGWSFSYGMRIDDAGSAVTATWEEGAQVRFVNQGGGNYSAPAHHMAGLVRNGDGTWTLTRRVREILTFNPDGSLAAVSDLNGYATTLAYSSGRLSTVTDAAGRALRFNWVGDRIESVTDSATPPRRVGFAYESGRLIQATDVMSGRMRFGYDPAGRLATLRRPRYADDTTTVAVPHTVVDYDANGRVASITDALGRLTRIDYGLGTTMLTDARSRISTFRHSGGLITAKTLGTATAAEATWRFAYDTATLGCTRVTDPGGYLWDATYDDAGNQTSRRDPSGRRWSFLYDALNNMTTATDPAQVTTTLGYAGPNLVSASVPLLGPSGEVLRNISTRYLRQDPAHPDDVTTVVDPTGASWAYTYDSFGYRASASDPRASSPRRLTTVYDDVGRLRASTSPRGNEAGASPDAFTTRYDYDAADRLGSVTDPLGNRRSTSYDADGNAHSSTDSRSKVTSYVFDPAGQLRSTTYPGAEARQVIFEYWPDAKMKSRSVAGATTTYDYDSAGRISTLTDQAGRTTTYEYDSAGRLAGIASPGGSCSPPASGCAAISRDTAGRVTALDYADAAT